MSITASNNASNVVLNKNIAVTSNVDKISLLSPIAAVRPGNKQYLNVIGRGSGVVGLAVGVIQGGYYSQVLQSITYFVHSG